MGNPNYEGSIRMSNFSEETASSSESERETDSSEHNGMTESMWTESETGN